jgi:hypothetical protein
MEIALFMLLGVARIGLACVVPILGHQYERAAGHYRREQLTDVAHMFAHGGVVFPGQRRAWRGLWLVGLSLAVSLLLLLAATVAWFAVAASMSWVWQVVFMVVVPLFAYATPQPSYGERRWRVTLGWQGFPLWRRITNFLSLTAFVLMLIWAVSPHVS